MSWSYEGGWTFKTYVFLTKMPVKKNAYLHFFWSGFLVIEYSASAFSTNGLWVDWCQGWWVQRECLSSVFNVQRHSPRLKGGVQQAPSADCCSN